MNAQKSATVYQFPRRGRFAAGAVREEVKAEAAPRVVLGDGWYHDEAIEAERTRKN